MSGLTAPFRLSLQAAHLVTAGRSEPGSQEGTIMTRYALALLLSMAAAPAWGYRLTHTDSCRPGAAWVTGSTVKVRVLDDSFWAYADQHGLTSSEASSDHGKMIADIEAVIDEYNRVPGSKLTLDYSGLIFGDQDLGDNDHDDYADHRIVVGFTRYIDDPAVTPSDVDGCTIKESHVRFHKEQRWLFGPVSSTGVDGKAPEEGKLSFRAVLLHEMGHAVGLAHAKTTYAVMDHGTKAWTRGENETPQMELLPDDIWGVRDLYGSNAPMPWDVSVTNTYFLDSTHWDDDDAHQVRNCKVSSRADSYAEVADGATFCGVNDPGSTYPDVSNNICPGDELQLRYTINNKSDNAILTKEQVWLSSDEDLEVNGAAIDLKSPDERELAMTGSHSGSVGRVFRVPSSTPNGTYFVYVRVVPQSPFGDDWWSRDIDQWNNSIRVAGTIDVSSAYCH
jgi:hypothetical protein